jgi:hypothetical protein
MASNHAPATRPTKKSSGEGYPDPNRRAIPVATSTRAVTINRDFTFIVPIDGRLLR